jgi:Xaa-Pro aminopeptidase
MDLFARNRQRLIEKLNGGIIILGAYAGMQRSNDMAYDFEQEANFWWLTGIEAADWRLIIDGTRGKAWLVAPVLSDAHMVFDGALSPEVAIKVSGVDGVLSQEEAASKLRELAKKHSVVYTLGDPPHAEYLDFTLNPAPKKLHEQLERTFNSVHDCRKELAQLRALKQPEEIARIKKAINLTVDAFKHVRELLDGMTHEYEVEAEFTHYFRSRGAKGHAYDPIVATGKNACTLHYTQNDAKLKKRDLLLLDIGARRNGYAADITRTYIYGEPTKRAQAVHSAVVAAQKEIIALLEPNLLLEEYRRTVDAVMTDTLLSLGLMHDKHDETAYRKYFPHAVSHGLGVDVHDSMGGPRFLQPGMVLTVEPGIYIPEEGIGVRIEDNILITDTGRNNLSSHLSTDL